MNDLNRVAWRNACLGENSTIKEAIQCLNETALQIVLVVSDDDALLGTVTDGDIRRALISGLNLDQELSKICSKQFVSVAEGLAQRSEALKLMKQYRISAIPVVDHGGRPAGIELLLGPAESKNANDELVVLMAGGLGMRLRPLTTDVPKPMLKIRGKPILQHIIEQAIDQGFQNFVVALNYLGDVIQQHFNDGSAWGVNISYTRETEPLGTAGALSLIEPVPDARLVAMNADVITPFDLNDMLRHHDASNACATMAVSFQRTDLAYGVVQTDNGKITEIEEKPSLHHLVNAGLYVIEPDALSLIPPGQSFNMTDLFRKLIDLDRPTAAFALYEDWIDVGRPEQYRAVSDAEE